MNWEGFKTLLLTVLVLLSLVLTWNLWTFETDNHQIEQPKFVNTAISKDGKRTLGQVIHPDQAILHQQDGDLYGLGSGMNLNHMFQAIMSAQYENVQIYGQDPAIRKSKTNFKAQKPDSDSIEMIFPTAIPISLFGTILQGSSEGQTDKKTVFTSNDDFDRIVFYKANQEQATKLWAYFKDGKDKVGKAEVSNVSFTDLESFYKKNHKEEVIQREGLYLPAEPKLKQLQYFSLDWIGVSQFKKALFDHPDVPVEQQKNYFVGPSETLQVKDHILQFSNSEAGTSQVNKNSPPGNSLLPIIRTSFNYVDSHSGWTDSFILFDYKRDENGKSNSRESVVFRLMVGDGQTKYPVFGKGTVSYPLYEDSGEIMVILKKGTPYKYMRSLMNLDENSDPLKTKGGLKTGKDIWTELKTSKNVKMSGVEKVCVGYQKEVKEDEAVFTPKWFVLYKGNWYTVEQLTSAKNTAHGEVSQ